MTSQRTTLVGIPALKWLRGYDKTKLIGDATAGLTVAVMLIPQGLAYSALAGLPPVYGLYSSLVPLIVYALFASSMRQSIGPVAPTCIMIASALKGLDVAAAGTERWTQLALTMAFVGGIVQLVTGLVRAGSVASLLSWPVKTGYMAAAAVIILVSQLQDLFGLTYVKSDNVLVSAARAVAALPTGNSITAAYSLFALAALYYVPKWPKTPTWFPTPLAVIVAMLLVAQATDAETSGVKLVGFVPVGLPSLTWPFESMADIWLVLPSAISVSFVAFVGSISLALAFAHDPSEVDANQELIAFGIASIVGSFCSSFLVSGSFTRGAVNVQAGAKTPASNCFTALFVLSVLLVLAPLFRWLPTAVLAATIASTCNSLVKIPDLRLILKISAVDFGVSIVSFLAVMLWGMQTGICISIGLSAILLLVFAMAPGWANVGLRLSGAPQHGMGPMEDLASMSVPHGVKIVHVSGNLHFANIGTICTKLRKLLAEADGSANATTAVILHCPLAVYTDSTACQQLHGMSSVFAKRNIRLLIAGASEPVELRLRQFGPSLDDNFLPTVTESIKYLTPLVGATSTDV